MRHEDRIEQETERLQLHVSCGYLHGLIWIDSRSADHERNPDVKFIQLPFINGQGELT